MTTAATRATGPVKLLAQEVPGFTRSLYGNTKLSLVESLMVSTRIQNSN